ncbi:hypothetical protein O181_000767 [Austropuccinia psidii MF-1]|uniref:Uncharacterized protein n=1 Tax=Austropuccinia psidii MF-1 TaxID=1389203 RepID=A0A9Q3GCD5_9BASI|nr:hypothetical protein [Austropuccinia psidii MF-1]
MSRSHSQGTADRHCAGIHLNIVYQCPCKTRGHLFPLLPYLLQENGKAEHLNQILGDMAQSGIPAPFWQFAYAFACFLHNCIPNSQCVNSSRHQELYGTAPSITTIYPFGEDSIFHKPVVHQPHKIMLRGIKCKLTKPLMSGGWLMGEPSTNTMVQSASVVFPHSQLSRVSSGPVAKGLLTHVVTQFHWVRFQQSNISLWKIKQ